MRKNNFFAYAGAIALLSTALAACSSQVEELIAKPQTNLNAETGEVNTQFVFNVSTNNTRMATNAAQVNVSESTPFRGIEKANILAYKLTKTDASDKSVPNDGQYIATAQAPDKLYDLATILSSNSITSTDSRRVIELSLPLATNTMMFYGKAIKENGYHGQYGMIDFNVGTGGNATSFKLRNRLGSVENGATKLAQIQDMISAILSRLAQTALYQETEGQMRNLRYAFWWQNSSSATGANAKEATIEEKAQIFADNSTYKNGVSQKTVDGITYTLYFGDKAWSDYGNDYKSNLPAAQDGQDANKELKPLEEILGEAYYEFTNIKTNEVRAGSGLSIERTVGDLWAVINKVRLYSNTNPQGATATSVAEYIAQLMAERLNTRLETYFSMSSGTCAFLTVQKIKTNMNTFIYYGKTTNATTIYDKIADGDLQSFPTNLNLPLGSAQLTFDSDHKSFSYKNGNVTFQLNGEAGTSIEKIMWPAELCYFGNSPLRTSDEAKVQSDYPATVAQWEDNSNSAWSDFEKNSHVLSTTRSVAMQNDINYGTALLETTVKFGAAKLNDNNSAIHKGEADKSIDASQGAFTLTGVLIGGQNNEMGWNYLRKYSADETDENGVKHFSDFNYVIYDNYVGGSTAGYAIPAYTAAGAATTPNHTIVFDNYSSGLDVDKQSDVLVCLEFKNNAQDFYGKDNMIRKDATFYIVGKLIPGEATNHGKLTWPEATDDKAAHPLPPYDSDGKTIKAERVFIQDYKTTANFTIGANSLKYAFATVPDLRATQLSLGLSVDLSWSTGLNFNDILLGGE